MNRRYRRWLAKQPEAYRESIEDSHRIIADMQKRIELEKAMDGVDAMIAIDQDATEALRHFDEVTRKQK